MKIVFIAIFYRPLTLTCIPVNYKGFVLFCLNGPQILDPVVGRPLVGFSLKPKGLACL